MSRNQRSAIRWLTGTLVFIISALVFSQDDAPQPTITMLGFQQSDAQVEWIFTVGNTGTSTARHLVVTDTLPAALVVDHVQINTGSANVDGQTVTVVLPELQPRELVQFSVFTSVLTQTTPVNVACATADNYSGDVCVRGMAVQTLPSTGETPYWRQSLLLLSLLTISASLLMIGMGLLGWQVLAQD